MLKYVFLFLCSLFLTTHETQAAKEKSSRGRLRRNPYPLVSTQLQKVNGYLYQVDNLSEGLVALQVNSFNSLHTVECPEDAEIEAFLDLARNSPQLQSLSIKGHDDIDSALCVLYQFYTLRALILASVVLTDDSVVHLLDGHQKELFVKNSILDASFFKKMDPADTALDPFHHMDNDSRTQYQKRNRFEVLDFTDTRISFRRSSEYEYFPVLKNLKKLILANTYIPENLSLLPCLGCCESLEEIDLSGQNLHGLGAPGAILATLASLKNLKKITLSKCANDSRTNLFVLQKLVDLLTNVFTDAHAGMFPALEEIVLSGYAARENKADWYLTDASCLNIRVARPRLKVILTL